MKIELGDFNHLGKKDEKVDDLAWGNDKLDFKELNILYSILVDITSSSKDYPSERIKELNSILKKLSNVMAVIR